MCCSICCRQMHTTVPIAGLLLNTMQLAGLRSVHCPPPEGCVEWLRGVAGVAGVAADRRQAAA